MARDERRQWLPILLSVVAAVMLFGCGEKWEATEFPEAGFSATFPMPVMSQPKTGGILHHWAHAGDVQLQVVRSPMPVGTALPADADEALRGVYEELRNGGNAREVSPPRLGQFQARYAMLEFHISGKAADGRDSDTKGRMVLAGNQLFMASALWPTGDKKGPQHADRFLDSFKLR